MVTINRRVQLVIVFTLSVFAHRAHSAEIEFFSPSGEVKKEIQEVEGKLYTLDETIESKRSQRSALLHSHMALGELCIGKERLPKSYERQRELLLTLDLEIENLDRVKANLETKLAQLQSELTRAVLYEEKVAGYRSAEQEFLELTDSVCKEIEQVNQAIGFY